HDRHKACAFFVGPDNEFEWRFGFDVVVLQCAHDFKTGHDTIAAVKFTAGRLGIDMAAGGDGRQIGVAPRPPPKNVADLVDCYAQAGIFHPADHQIPGLSV